MSEEKVLIPASLIDEFGEVSKLRNDFAPTERLYQRLRSELGELFADADPEQEFGASGEKYSLYVSDRKTERKVDVKAARKRLGAAAFLDVCSVSLKALEAFLLKPEIDALAVSERTGSRRYETADLG